MLSLRYMLSRAWAREKKLEHVTWSCSPISFFSLLFMQWCPFLLPLVTSLLKERSLRAILPQVLDMLQGCWIHPAANQNRLNTRQMKRIPGSFRMEEGTPVCKFTFPSRSTAWRYTSSSPSSRFSWGVPIYPCFQERSHQHDLDSIERTRFSLLFFSLVVRLSLQIIRTPHLRVRREENHPVTPWNRSVYDLFGVYNFSSYEQRTEFWVDLSSPSVSSMRELIVDLSAHSILCPPINAWMGRRETSALPWHEHIYKYIIYFAFDFKISPALTIEGDFACLESWKIKMRDPATYLAIFILEIFLLLSFENAYFPFRNGGRSSW